MSNNKNSHYFQVMHLQSFGGHGYGKHYKVARLLKLDSFSCDNMKANMYAVYEAF